WADLGYRRRRRQRAVLPCLRHPVLAIQEDLEGERAHEALSRDAPGALSDLARLVDDSPCGWRGRRQAGKGEHGLDALQLETAADRSPRSRLGVRTGGRRSCNLACCPCGPEGLHDPLTGVLLTRLRGGAGGSWTDQQKRNQRGKCDRSWAFHTS